MDANLVRERISEVLASLAAIAEGSLEERPPTTLDPDDPFAALHDAINAMVRGLHAARLEFLDQQRTAIRELSTPVIEVWAGVLCLPVVGLIDTVRSAEMTESLLRAVTEKKCRYVIIDVTGIEVMDSRTTDHFLRMARAVGLLGARCVIAGISPGIAQTIVHMGVELRDIGTFRSLRDALADHVKRTPVAAR